MQFGHEGVCDGGFAAAAEAGEEDGDAAFMHGWIFAAEFFDDFGEAEPFWNGEGFLEAAAKFGATDVEGFDALGDFVDAHVLGTFFDIHHEAEVHHLDADFFFVLFEQFLRIVWAVKGNACGVVSGACVVAADDEVGESVVFPDEAVPYGFPWATHAHGEW